MGDFHDLYPVKDCHRASRNKDEYDKSLQEYGKPFLLEEQSTCYDAKRVFVERAQNVQSQDCCKDCYRQIKIVEQKKMTRFLSNHVSFLQLLA